MVWFTDVSDDKVNKKINGTIFKNEPMGLALRRFNCFRVSVLDMPDGRLKEKYAKMTPSFSFFDPAANPIARPLVGKRATSLSAFSSLMDRAWARCFSMSFKKYTKDMKKILDRLDKADVLKTNQDRDKARLAKKPNPAKKAKLEREEAKLKAMLDEIEKDEQAIIDACALKPEFLTAENVGEE